MCAQAVRDASTIRMRMSPSIWPLRHTRRSYFRVAQASTNAAVSPGNRPSTVVRRRTPRNTCSMTFDVRSRRQCSAGNLRHSGPDGRIARSALSARQRPRKSSSVILCHDGEARAGGRKLAETVRKSPLVRPCQRLSLVRPARLELATFGFEVRGPWNARLATGPTYVKPLLPFQRPFSAPSKTPKTPAKCRQSWPRSPSRGRTCPKPSGRGFWLW